METARRLLAGALTLLLVAWVALLPDLAAQQQEQEEVARRVKTHVKPNYPELARRMNITGAVKIEVMIAPDGKVKSTRVIGGHPLLVDAALNAVKQWRFEPAAKETMQVVQFKFVRPGEE